MATDWTNACERADALRDAYYALLSGKKAQSITYQDVGVQRTVTYMSTQVDLTRLRDELRAAEEECATGDKVASKARYAMRGGALRR